MGNLSNAIPWLALTVSVASACLAWAAWWTSRERLRLDLYNRRFDIYSRTLDFYHALHEWQPTGAEKISTSLQDSPELRKTQRAFIKASREAQFLFPDDSGVHNQLERIRTLSMGVIGYKRDIGPAFRSQSPEVLQAYEKFINDLTEINSSIPLLEQRMSPHLDFHTLFAWRIINKKPKKALQ